MKRRVGGRTASVLAAAVLLACLATAALAAPGGGSVRSNRGADPTRALKKAQALIAEWNYADAIVELEKARRAAPRNADVHNMLGYCYRNQKDYERAIEYYERALKYDRKHRGALEYMGQAYLEMGEREKAGEVLARLTRVCRRGCDELESLQRAFEQAAAADAATKSAARPE